MTVMVTPKSRPLVTERYVKNTNANSMKYNDLFPKERYNNAHEGNIHSSNIIKDIRRNPKGYSQDRYQATPGVLINSSVVIKYLGKRSTEEFTNYLESDYQSSNRSKFKTNINYNRLENLNTIDRIDIDDKKLNNSKLPTNNATTKINSVNGEMLERTNSVHEN